jgi:hypothetical protein
MHRFSSILSGYSVKKKKIIKKIIAQKIIFSKKPDEKIHEFFPTVSS